MTMHRSTVSRFVSLIAVAAMFTPLPLATPFALTPAFAAQPQAPLGDLSTFRAIAEDTLAIVKTGDVAAARKRVSDLETAWDKAEPVLKAKDGKAWTAIDTALDETFAALRTPNAQPADCAAALQKLLATFDTYK